jgi:hypothetical protein
MANIGRFEDVERHLEEICPRAKNNRVYAVKHFERFVASQLCLVDDRTDGPGFDQSLFLQFHQRTLGDDL